MANTLIIGDGPGALSAALFLAKNGQQATVFGNNETPMHYAMLYNYLGIEEITGTDFLNVSRAQAAKFGASIQDKQVAGVEQKNGSFVVTTEDGASHEGQYLILSEGKALKLANSIGLSTRDDGVVVDFNCQTETENLYAVGRCIRRRRTQAVISAGEGAVAALDILAKENGEADFVDFDEVED